MKTDNDSRAALLDACLEHLRSGGDAVTEAAVAWGWQKRGEWERSQALQSERPDGSIVDGLRKVEEALRMFCASEAGTYLSVARHAKPSLFGGMDGDIPFAYRWPKEGTRDTGDAIKADEFRREALALIPSLIDRVERLQRLNELPTDAEIEEMARWGGFDGHMLKAALGHILQLRAKESGNV